MAEENGTIIENAVTCQAFLWGNLDTGVGYEEGDKLRLGEVMKTWNGLEKNGRW